jgi:hypothetical protein
LSEKGHPSDAINIPLKNHRARILILEPLTGGHAPLDTMTSVSALQSFNAVFGKLREIKKL